MKISCLKRLTALLCLLCLLAGCGPAAPADTAAPGRTVTDCVGREVAIPAQPERIACLDSFSGEAIVMAGAGERLVSVPNGVRMDVLLQALYPGLEEVDVTMSGGTIHAEALLALRPDLVLVKGALYASDGEMSKLDKLGIPYLVIEYSGMEEQLFAMELIGSVLGRQAEERMGQMTDYYRDVIARAEAIARTIPEEERVRVYHAINEVVRTDGAQSLGRDWIECVGAVNVACQGENLAKGDYEASMEQIYAWDPDVVICNEADTVDYLMANDKWAGLRAVREGEVYNIPVGATRWGQRGSLETFFAILWLGKTIYPEAYAQIDLKREVQDFYETTLCYTLDDATYEQILSGRGLRSVRSQGQ